MNKILNPMNQMDFHFQIFIAAITIIILYNWSNI